MARQQGRQAARLLKKRAGGAEGPSVPSETGERAAASGAWGCSMRAAWLSPNPLPPCCRCMCAPPEERWALPVPWHPRLVPSACPPRRCAAAARLGAGQAAAGCCTRSAALCVSFSGWSSGRISGSAMAWSVERPAAAGKWRHSSGGDTVVWLLEPGRRRSAAAGRAAIAVSSSSSSSSQEGTPTSTFQQGAWPSSSSARAG